VIKNINVPTSIKYARLKPPISRSQQPRGSLATRAKKDEKENDDQHQDHN
jgi:hypothetical protein